jgi:hypothetical protein
MMYDLRNGHFEGQLYLAKKTKPIARDAADGTFCITLLAYSRPAPHILTPWRITWAGEAALGFWCQYGPDMLPGVAINVDLAWLTVMDGAGRNAGAEIHARAMLIELANQTTAAGSQAEPAHV